MILIKQQTLVHHAIALGVDLIDTAEQYGESEAILGKCLRAIPQPPRAIFLRSQHSDSGPLTITAPVNLNNVSAHEAN